MLNSTERSVIQMASIAPKTMKEFLKCLKRDQEIRAKLREMLQTAKEECENERRI